MNTPESSAFDAWLNRIKQILEVIAIPVVAYWAFTRFAEGEAPSLELRHDIESSLNGFDSTATNYCLGQFGVSVKNIGKVSFDIESVAIRAWLTTPKAPESAVGYLSPIRLKRNPPHFEEIVTDYVIGHYAPEVKVQNDFVFVLERKPGQFALFEIEAKVSSRNYPDGFPIYEYQWDYVCGETNSEEVPKKTPH